MGKRQMDLPNTPGCALLEKIAVDLHRGFAQRVAVHLNVLPPHVPAQTRSQGFHKGFLGSETHCIAGVRWMLCAAVLLFNVGVDPRHKALASPHDDLLDTLDLDEVDANAVDHGAVYEDVYASGL
jgi:hypothetical protein